MSWRLVLALVVCCRMASPASAQDVTRGAIVDPVACADDPGQSYALYVPTSYAPERPAKLLLGFHPGARGRAIVELYRAAAEAYGYVVAASNNSRNGPWEPSMQAAIAMSTDVARRLAIDERRLYLTGMSGGARVAMQLALGTKAVAGVIASSAGYPDVQPRAQVPFAVFATAGVEDFNYLEMRQLDRALTTPHRLVVFDGGHTLPPPEVALDAIEWLEVQAMASGLAPRDEAWLARHFERRRQAAADAGPSPRGVRLLRDLAADFAPFRDVSALASEADTLAARKDVRSAIAREREEEGAELRQVQQIFALEAGLAAPDQSIERLAQLRALLARVSKDATRPEDSPARTRARRVLRTVLAGARERAPYPDYLKVLEEYRVPPQAPAPKG